MNMIIATTTAGDRLSLVRQELSGGDHFYRWRVEYNNGEKPFFTGLPYETMRSALHDIDRGLSLFDCKNCQIIADRRFFVSEKQLDLLRGFFLHCWTAYHGGGKLDGYGWGELLDRAGISWSVQNLVAMIAETRTSGGYYLRGLLNNNGVAVGKLEI